VTITDLMTLPEVRGWRLEASPSPRQPLTPREREVIEIVTGGRSHKEAAFELGVADATVRVLYARAMKKLGRSNRRTKKLPARP
jgi:DNA-binding NarL/FixJ family response regulator